MQAPPRSAGFEAGTERPGRIETERHRLDFRAVSVETKDARTREDAIPVLRGRNIWHFTDRFQPADLWTSEREAFAVHGPDLYAFRIAARGITGVYNRRTLVATIIPPGVAVNNTVLTSVKPRDLEGMLLILALLNSFVADWEFRLTVFTTASAYFFHQLHLPRPHDGDPLRAQLVQGAAALVCTRPDFDRLRVAAFLSEDQVLHGDRERWLMECRLDALAARAYRLDHAQFAHVLSSFPLVSKETREQVLHDFARLEEER